MSTAFFEQTGNIEDVLLHVQVFVIDLEAVLSATAENETKTRADQSTSDNRNGDSLFEAVIA